MRHNSEYTRNARADKLVPLKIWKMIGTLSTKSKMISNVQALSGEAHLFFTQGF